MLIVINSLDIGGTESHLLRVLPRLNASRFNVSLLALRCGGTQVPDFIESGIFVLDDAGGRASSIFRLAMEIKRVRPLVHCFLPETYLLGASLALLLGANSVIMSRRCRNHYQHRYRVAAWVERRLHRRMDALLGNSQAVIRDLLDEGAPPDRVRLIHNGIDVSRYLTGEDRVARRHAVRFQLGVPKDAVVLICVANLFPYKGHADLLSALARLGPVFFSRCLLLLVGRDVGTMASLRGQASRLGLSDRVRFLGERGDVPDLLAASDIGVLASHEEGFSNAVLEGMASMLPMVVTDVGGSAEAVIDGNCGYVVPARDPARLAEAIALLIDDAGRRRTMGMAARQRVASLFSLDACVAAYEALYEEVWDRCRNR